MRALSLGLVVFAIGCEPAPASQLMIHVIDGSGGAMRVPEDLDAFEIRVASVTTVDALPSVRFQKSWALGPAGGARSPAGVSLPQTLAIVPAADDGTGTVRIDVAGLRRGRALQRIHRTVAFGIGLVDVPAFALTPLCFGVECPADQTCEADGLCHAAAGPPDGGAPGGDAGACGAGLVACGDSCVPSDEANCGACGMVCPAGERCVSGRCACGVGLVRCGAACVDVATDPSSCGACGVVCALASATSACEGGACRIVACDPGTADCNGAPGDGCETRLGVDGDCESCGDRCPLSHATSTCAGGSCAVGSCDGGWDDCDGNASNGCETDLGTTSDCGSCGSGCGSNEACGGGVCDCRGGYDRRGGAGPCLPSCGHLANLRGLTDDGMGCCPSGCSATVIGSPGETYDCDWCCENVGGASGCL